MIKLEKVMTRDTPLIIVEAWYQSFEEVSDFFQIKWPSPIFIFRDGAVESWRPKEIFYHQLPEQISAWTKKSHKNIKKLLDAFDDHYRFSKILKNTRVKLLDNYQIIEEINNISNLFVKGCIGLVPAFWVIEWNFRALREGKPSLFTQEIIQKAQKLRQGDSLFDDANNLIYQYLDMVAKHDDNLKQISKFLLKKELVQIINKAEKSQSIINRFRDRAQGYIYFNHKLCLINQLDKILKKYNYQLVEPPILSRNTFRGGSANRGLVRGIVVIIRNRDEINKMTKDAILVAPMTTPFYLPAIKQASAIITDEGGLLSHAAIISRELNKPCIIGTKIATRVLQDGDLVEVDANNGVVKKL